MAPRLVVAALLGAVLLPACGDPTDTGPGYVTTILTDAPFPYDQASRVDVYIVRVMAATSADTGTTTDDTVARGLHTIAEPRRRINLLELTNGEIDSLGNDPLLPSSPYQYLRITIRVDSTSITLSDSTVLTSTSSPGIDFGTGGVERSFVVFFRVPVEVPSGGANILIDFNVGRSFLPLDPLRTADSGFQFTPSVLAVNTALIGFATGRIVGNAAGAPPVPNALVTFFEGSSGAQWTSKTNANGEYIAILPAGGYTYRADAPPSSVFGSGVPSIPTLIGISPGATTAVPALGLPVK